MCLIGMFSHYESQKVNGKVDYIVTSKVDSNEARNLMPTGSKSIVEGETWRKYFKKAEFCHRAWVNKYTFEFKGVGVIERRGGISRHAAPVVLSV